MDLRILFWNTRGQSVPPSIALGVAFEAQADIVCIGEPSGAFGRATHDSYVKVPLAGHGGRMMYVFHVPWINRAWSRTPNGLGNSGEACCVKFVQGNDALTIGFCHAQFTAGRRDASDTAGWMGSFEAWLRQQGADMYLGDTNMGRPGNQPLRFPRGANNTAILGDRGTTDAGNPYDKGKLLTQRVELHLAGLIKPARLRPAPSPNDHDDDKDADGDFYVQMPPTVETQYWQSDHRPIYAEVRVIGGA